MHLDFALDIFDMPAEHGNATQAATNCHLINASCHQSSWPHDCGRVWMRWSRRGQRGRRNHQLWNLEGHGPLRLHRRRRKHWCGMKKAERRSKSFQNEWVAIACTVAERCLRQGPGGAAPVSDD